MPNQSKVRLSQKNKRTTISNDTLIIIHSLIKVDINVRSINIILIFYISLKSNPMATILSINCFLNDAILFSSITITKFSFAREHPT